MLKSFKKVLSGILSVILCTTFCPMIAGATVTGTADATAPYALALGFEDGTVGSVHAINAWNDEAAKQANNASKFEAVATGDAVASPNGSDYVLKVTQSTGVSMRIPVTILPGQDYNLSFWIKVDDKQTETSLSSKFEVVSFMDGSQVATPVYCNVGTSNLVQGSWVKINKTFTAGTIDTNDDAYTGPVETFIVFRPYHSSASNTPNNTETGGARTVWYDDIVLEPAQTTEEIISGGSFEADPGNKIVAMGNDNDSTPGYWVKKGTNNADRKDTFTWVRGPEKGNPTNGYISKEKGTGNGNTTLATPALDLEPGHSYLVSAMFKSGLKNVTFSDDYAMIERLRISYNIMSQTNETGGTAIYANSSGNSSGSKVTSEWTRRDVVITIPEKTELTYATLNSNKETSTVLASEMEATYPDGALDEVTGIYTAEKDGVTYSVYTKPYFRWSAGNVYGSYTVAGATEATAATKQDPILVDELKIIDLSQPGELYLTNDPSSIVEGKALTSIRFEDKNDAEVFYNYKQLRWSETAKDYYVATSGSDLTTFVPAAEDVGNKLMFLVQGYSANADGTYHVGTPRIIELSAVVQPKPAVASVSVDGTTVTANLTSITSGILIAAAYDEEGNLVGCTIGNAADAVEGVATLTFATAPVGAASYKVFAWSDLASIEPIADVPGIYPAE